MDGSLGPVNPIEAAADEGTMSRLARAPLLVLFAGVAAIYVTFRGFAPQSVGDYGTEAAPAMNALLGGHIHAFFALEPAYGGSLLLRAPFAVVAKLLGGGELAIYRAGAFVCVLTCGLVGVWLVKRMRSRTRRAVAWLPVLLICALAPLITGAVVNGHPEEALGASLCVVAVLLAAAGRASIAGLALGLAILTKQWGVLAALPALLAVPAGSGARARIRLAAIAAALPAAQLVVAHLGAGGGQLVLVRGAQAAGFAHAFDLWWPLAHATRHLAVGTPPWWITNWSPPPFVAGHAHELIVLLSVPLAALAVRRHGRTPPVEVCVLLLALLFLLRCALDPQDLFYYHLPFIIALVVWESHARRGTPWVSIGTLLTLYVVFELVSPADAHTWADFGAYLMIAVPVAGYLFVQLLGRPGRRGAAVAPATMAPVGS